MLGLSRTTPGAIAGTCVIPFHPQLISQSFRNRRIGLFQQITVFKHWANHAKSVCSESGSGPAPFGGGGIPGRSHSGTTISILSA